MPIRLPIKKNDKEKDIKEHIRLLAILDTKKKIITNKRNVITGR